MIAGCSISEVVLLNVIGPPLIKLQTPMSVFSAMVGTNFMTKLLTYGHPEAFYIINKRNQENSEYVLINNNCRIRINKDFEFVIDNVEHDHAGDYQIVGINKHGEFKLNFTVNVTGVGECMHMCKCVSVYAFGITILPLCTTQRPNKDINEFSLKGS